MVDFSGPPQPVPSPIHTPFCVVIVGLVSLLAGCQSTTIVNNKSGDPIVLRIGVIDFGRQDPENGVQQPSRSLSFEGLTGNSRDGRPVPRLAESWTVSPDGLEWIFKLRANAKFHDGSWVDAATVKRSLDQSLLNLSDRSLFPGVEDILSIDTSGANELVIRLRNRSTFLVGDLSMAISKPAPGKQTVGTGPFIATETSREQIVMSSFNEYYEGAPRIQKIVWKLYPALRTAWAGMMRGEVDFLYDVGQESLEFVQGESSVGTFAFLRPYAFGVVFNSRRGSLKDPRVRQALNFAVNRQLILERALGGHGVVAHAPIWPLHWAYDRTIVGFTYDPVRARAILDSAASLQKRSRGAGSPVSPARFRFTCLLPENFGIWERMALLVQKQLFEVGVDMKLEALPPDKFLERLSRGDFDAVFLELSGASMSRPYVFWHSASPRNWFGYRNHFVDEPLDHIRRASDDQAYRAAVAELQRAMIANPPAIFLAWGQTARAVSRRFQVVSAPDNDILSSVGAWRVAESSASIVQ